MCAEDVGPKDLTCPFCETALTPSAATLDAAPKPIGGPSVPRVPSAPSAASPAPATKQGGWGLVVAVAVLGAVVGLIFLKSSPSPPPAEPTVLGASCPSEITDARLRCHGQVTDEDWYTWNVTKKGRYALAVYTSSKKVTFKPGLLVTNAAGAAVADVSGALGVDATTTFDATPGVYKLKVFPADGSKVKGGHSYELEISAP